MHLPKQIKNWTEYVIQRFSMYWTSFTERVVSERGKTNYMRPYSYLTEIPTGGTERGSPSRDWWSP